MFNSVFLDLIMALRVLRPKNDCVKSFSYLSQNVGRVDQSVKRLATGWKVRGSNPGGSEIFRTCPYRPWGPLSLLYKGYRVFPEVKCGRGVTLTPHPLLVPWS